MPRVYDAHIYIIISLLDKSIGCIMYTRYIVYTGREGCMTLIHCDIVCVCLCSVPPICIDLVRVCEVCMGTAAAVGRDIRTPDG